MENIFGEGDLPPWKPLQMSMKICDRAIYHSKLSVLDQIMLTVTPPPQKQPNSTCGLCIWNTMHVRIKKYMYNVHVWLVYSMSPTEWKGHLSKQDTLSTVIHLSQFYFRNFSLQHEGTEKHHQTKDNKTWTLEKTRGTTKKVRQWSTLSFWSGKNTGSPSATDDQTKCLTGKQNNVWHHRMLDERP